MSPCREGEVQWLKELDPNFGLLFDTGLEEARAELSAQEERRNALFFTLASFDKNLSAELRCEAAELSDESSQQTITFGRG